MFVRKRCLCPSRLSKSHIFKWLLFNQFLTVFYIAVCVWKKETVLQKYSTLQLALCDLFLLKIIHVPLNNPTTIAYRFLSCYYFKTCIQYLFKIVSDISLIWLKCQAKTKRLIRFEQLLVNNYISSLENLYWRKNKMFKP